MEFKILALVFNFVEFLRLLPYLQTACCLWQIQDVQIKSNSKNSNSKQM